MGDLVLLECDQLFHELVHRFFVKWWLWFAKRIRNMSEFGQRGTRLELELSSGFILPGAGVRQVFEFIHFGWLNEKKRYWSVSPSPPLPTLSKYLPRAGSKRAYTRPRTETTCLAWSSRLFKAKFFERAMMGIERNVKQTLTMGLKD